MITSATTRMLRAAPVRACSLRPTSLRTTACPYSAFASPSISISRPARSVLRVRKTNPAPRTIVTVTNPKATSFIRVCNNTPTTVSRRRHASSSTPTSTAEHGATTVSAPNPEQLPLDWNTFFALRKQRRRLQLAFSAAGCVAGGTLGALFLSTGQADWLVNQVPLDPLVTLGLMTFGCAALGWLLGPIAGSAIFYVLKRKYKVQMTIKESQFFARIKKRRVDPSNSSAGNPVPDFYGEKIQSVAGYRQWLKDQRAYNKKRTTFIK